jgi:hypothetical protein
MCSFDLIKKAELEMISMVFGFWFLVGNIKKVLRLPIFGTKSHIFWRASTRLRAQLTFAHQGKGPL